MFAHTTDIKTVRLLAYYIRMENMSKNRIITVQDIPITVSEADIDDYICITDMATAKSDSSRAADVKKLVKK